MMEGLITVLPFILIVWGGAACINGINDWLIKRNPRYFVYKNPRYDIWSLNAPDRSTVEIVSFKLGDTQAQLDALYVKCKELNDA